MKSLTTTEAYIIGLATCPPDIKNRMLTRDEVFTAHDMVRRGLLTYHQVPEWRPKATGYFSATQYGKLALDCYRAVKALGG